MTRVRSVALLAIVAAACSSTTATTTAPPTTSAVTTTAPTTTQPSLPAPPATIGRCQPNTEPIDTGTVANPDIVEASGMVLGRVNPGVLWLHNDSDDAARLFAVSTQGEDLGEFVLDGILPVDAEDIAIGPGPEDGTPYLYLADIGDNLDAWDDVSVYRIPEPVVGAPGVVIMPGAERFVLRYPDGPRNAEAFFVDPEDGAFYVITREGGEVYRASGTETEETLELVASIEPRADGLVTGADITELGGYVAVRTYFSVSLWPRVGSLAETFATEPCVGDVAFEPQGEAIAFSGDGAGYYTVSEGQHPTLHYTAVDR